MIDGFTNPQRQILSYLGHSLIAIVKGLGIGAVFAIVFSGLSVVSSTFNAIYNLIVSIFDLLPGVALLPILMITVGANDTSILILVVHSVIWPMSRNIIDGFKTTPRMYIEAGKNMGLGTLGLVTGVYIPASFASMLSGIKVGWARAWRGLISAEMIFGAAQSAGIGVYINNARTVWIDYPSVYAAIILIIIVGVIVEYCVFRVIEKLTVRKWGMVR
ncbi:MAG: ABC transporter permease subunit [Lachnospiraceae bacterium]|nr:ABC transporter permease subunit [Lachnospiraceae bacterium]